MNCEYNTARTFCKFYDIFYNEQFANKTNFRQSFLILSKYYFC